MALELAAGITLFFCRHGETQANVEGRFQGHSTDTPLTMLGREQAQLCGSILKRAVGGQPALSFVASPLGRARKTMELILEDLILPADNYQTDIRLREINLGAWDGLTDAEARALDPEMFNRREHDKWNIRVPGGENYADVAARAESWANALRCDTFAVSHGAFTRILRGLFDDMSWQQMSALDEPQDCVFRVRGHDVIRLDADAAA